VKYKNLGVHASLKDVNRFIGFTDVFQIGLQNPNSFVHSFDEMNKQAQEWRKMFPGSPIVCHAPFITNLTVEDYHTNSKTVNLLVNHVRVCRKYDIKFIVVHPGQTDIRSNNFGSRSISLAVKLLKKVFSETGTCNTNILLENLPSPISLALEELEEIASKVKNVGICLDLNHCHGSGTNMKEAISFIRKSVVKMIHLNSVPKGDIFGGASDKHTHTPIYDSGEIAPATLIKVISDYPNKIKIMEQYPDFAVKSFRFLKDHVV
jgi:endonuclease IV